MYSTEAFRVTDTGKPDEIFNGVPDWVYEGKYSRCYPADSKLGKNLPNNEKNRTEILFVSRT